MPSLILRRRLAWLEIPLLIGFFYLFYLVTDRKEIGYAAGMLAGLGVLFLAFFRPRWGLVCILALAFMESTLDVMNNLARSAVEAELTGVPYVSMPLWLVWGVLIIYSILLLSYLCREFLLGRRLKPLSGLEWVLLTPLIVALCYLPISMVYENHPLDFFGDIIPLLIYAGVVVLARVFSSEGNTRRVRYFFVDWFVLFNILIILPLWAYNFKFELFRNATLGIAAIRYGTGAYDFNFFLVPLLGMILTHDDELSPGRRKFYQFAFFLSLLRVVVSLFRGAMAGTFAAIVIATFLVEAGRRRRWMRILLLTLLATVALILALVATVPAARATFRVAFLGRIEQVIERGGGGSIQFRQLETEAALEDIMRRPILGYGPGVKITKHFDPEEYASEELYLHSGYVWFWYKMGIMGLGVIAVFFLGIYWTCISLLRRSLHPIDRGWVIGTLAATIAMLPVIHTNNMIIRSQGAYTLTLLLMTLCLIVARYRGVPRDQLPPAEKAVDG